MTTTTFFFIFIPLLAFILLAVNFIFAPHNPYQEKDSVFECGFHSFLGQNRTQFSISFFIFALLFLLFDLEILLVYPYIVSGYTNSTYGLVIMLIFFSVLTIGFVFELGKKALKIDSRQVFSLAKRQQTTTTTAVSGFFSFLVFFFSTCFWKKTRGKMRDYLAIFKGLIKLEYLKLALKKVFSPWPSLIMVIAWIVSVVIRLLLKKYDSDFIFFESDILFHISSISTIFTATLIRKYFQLFNSLFESIDWSAVYYFFTCSNTERSKVLLDFIKSLESFHNEKIKVNNFEDSSKHNVSSRKPFNIHDINNNISQMKKAPSNSLTRPSGSGNNNTTVARSSGSGNNNNSVAGPSGSGNNNKSVANPYGPNKLTAGRLSVLDRERDALAVAAAKQAAAAINDSSLFNHSVIDGKVVGGYIFPGPCIAYPERKLKYLSVLSGAFQDNTRNPFQLFSRSPSPFAGSISSITTDPGLNTGWVHNPEYSDNWNTALTKLHWINTSIFLQVYQSGAINNEIEAIKRVIDIMFGEIGAASHQQMESSVGYTLTEKTMREVLSRYPIYQWNHELPFEPDLYTFTLHMYNSLKHIYDELFSRAQIFESYHYILFRTVPYKVSQYRQQLPDYYKIVAALVDQYGSDELKVKFARQDEPINNILISLANHSHDLFMAGSQYGIMLDSFIIKSRTVFVNDYLFKKSAYDSKYIYSTAQVKLGKVWFSTIDKWL